MIKTAVFLLLLSLGLTACTVREYHEERTWGIPTHVSDEVTTYRISN